MAESFEELAQAYNDARRINAEDMRRMDEIRRNQAQLISRAGLGLSGYVDAPSYAGINVDNFRLDQGNSSMPVYRTIDEAGRAFDSMRSFKYHAAHDRWLVCHNGTTYRLPGTDIKAHMIYELTIPQYEKIASVRADWVHIAQPGRQIDREIATALAAALFGDHVEVVFSDGAPVFDTFSYRRLINEEQMTHLLTETIWDELSQTLKPELRPKEFQLFFRGTTETKENNNNLNSREQWEDFIMNFAVLDYVQRALMPVDLEPYKNTLLFVRSVGGFRFENPGKLIIYDYPSTIHSSAEFGGSEVLHNPDGPAIGYADGKGTFAIEGFLFEPRVVLDKASITVKEIEAEQNMERRRILTDQMGIGRYLHETNAQVIQMDSVRVMTVGDDDRRMPRALIQAKDGRRFLCGTDGSTKRVYYMPVSRDVRTCQEAHEAIAGPVGRRSVKIQTPESQRWGGAMLQLGLDENDCIAQS